MQAAGDDAEAAEAGVSQTPAEKPEKPSAKPERTAREAAALRANLVKRKDQARRREAQEKKAPAS
jgi:hypothetical protein